MKRSNRYPGRCVECGKDVPTNEGYVLRAGRQWNVFCPACVPPNAVEDDQCEYTPSLHVENQLDDDTLEVPRCPNKKLPGMIVCSCHATKDGLVAALLTAYELLAELQENKHG